MFTFTDVVSKAMTDELALWRRFIHAEAFDSQEAIDVVRGAKDFELASRVRPLVFLSGREEDRTRCAERYQSVLIERQFLRAVVEFFVFRVEPVRETIVD